RGVVTYNINEDVSLFAGARRGYRAGGQLLSTSNIVGGFRFVDFDPEFLTSIEAGWRSQWMDNRLTFNGTVFYSQFDDQQVNLTDDEGFTFTTNAGETALYGLELSGDFRVTDDWRVYGSVGLLETDIDSFILVEDNPATAEDETVDLAGNELERSPNVSFTIGSRYDHPTGLVASASLNFRSESFSDVFNLGTDELGPGLTERVGPFALMNASVGYTYQNLTLTGFVTNLFDEEEPESINIAGQNAFTGVDIISDNIPSFNIQQPRTFGVSLDVTF
ncbi:MAG: TonB-dependent receptor, partial [Pseudomonadota bacterium]